MDRQPGSAEPDEAGTQAARRAAVQAYGRATDPAERRAILRQLLSDLAAEDPDLARARLLDWLAEESAPVDSPDQQRYEELLPQVLAGLLDSASADYVWFMSYLDECEACREEYAELRLLLDDEQAARTALHSTEVVPPALDFPTYDLNFLRDAPAADVTATALAQATWAAGVQARVEAGRSGAHGQLRLRFGAAKPPDFGSQLAVAEPDATGGWQTILSQVMPPDLDAGRRGLITLWVEAQREDALTCRLFLRISGPMLRTHEAGIAVTVNRPGVAPLQAQTDWLGIAAVEVPIAALPELTITLTLPPTG